MRQWDKHVSGVANEIGLIDNLHSCDCGTPYKTAEALYAYADCTVPGETDWENLRAVIDYAHTWRETHKK